MSKKQLSKQAPDCLIPSPWGSVAAWFSDAGLTQIALDWRKPCGKAPLQTKGAATLLEVLNDYFRGVDTVFDSIPVDMTGATPFQRQVWVTIRAIPWGATWTYGEVARRMGKPGAARAVGQALGVNPVPIIVPCHRVVGASGLGGFSGGLNWKKRLLDLEQTRTITDGSCSSTKSL